MEAARRTRRAGDRAGEPRRALLCRRHHAAAHDDRRRRELYPQIPLCMHQDHGNSPATCLSAIQQGFTSVMMDGSLKEDAKTPGRLRIQCRRSPQTVVELAHAVGVSVEGEIGCWARSRPGTARPRTATAPRAAVARPAADRSRRRPKDFVARTKVDALAVAIGTSHGAYKFNRKPTGDILAMDVIEEIHERLPDTHLVMHGIVLRAPGAAGRLQRARRQDAGRPGACRSRRSSAASSTACARSTSTRTAASP